MFSLSKAIQNKYIAIILILAVCYIFSHAIFRFLSSVNFSIVIYMIIIKNIDESNYIPYSIIFGLYSDYMTHSFIGLNILFFLFISLVKIFSEYKFNLKSSVSLIFFSLTFIFLYNFFLFIILGYDFTFSYMYILKVFIINFVVYLIIYFFMEFYNAFYGIKR